MSPSEAWLSPITENGPFQWEASPESEELEDEEDEEPPHERVTDRYRSVDDSSLYTQASSWAPHSGDRQDDNPALESMYYVPQGGHIRYTHPQSPLPEGYHPNQPHVPAPPLVRERYNPDPHPGFAYSGHDATSAFLHVNTSELPALVHGPQTGVADTSYTSNPVDRNTYTSVFPSQAFDHDSRTLPNPADPSLGSPASAMAEPRTSSAPGGQPVLNKTTTVTDFQYPYPRPRAESSSSAPTPSTDYYHYDDRTYGSSPSNLSSSTGHQWHRVGQQHAYGQPGPSQWPPYDDRSRIREMASGSASTQTSDQSYQVFHQQVEGTEASEAGQLPEEWEDAVGRQAGYGTRGKYP